MKKDAFIWWKHGTIYQIYPRSFYDSNNDGIGDINGIIEKLDYLQNLGISGIWISPICSSPMCDFGYDISDYRSLDPIFGNISDFKKLIKEAHKRDIHIIMDMVINHTSNQHPWFIESKSSTDNDKKDWYLWVDGKKGKRPNNWRAAFGGDAWQWSEERQQYYCHLFLKEQPDLNWRNKNVEKAVFADIEYWLKLGVDGFRLDVINYIVKDKELKNNPYFLHKAPPRRHDMQSHLYDRNQPETHKILKRLRKLLNKYSETMLVGEIYPNEGVMEPETSASYLGNGKDELHLAFDFSTMFARFSAHSFKKILNRWYEALPENGWPTHVLSNHDQSRSMTRLAKGDIAKEKILLSMLLTQKGTPFLYFGEELGMNDGKIKRKEIVDPVGKLYWPLYPGRDRSRTPMLWNKKKGAGFSRKKPWLPVNPEYKDINVENQLADKNSLFYFTRSLIHLRKTEEALCNGEIEFHDSHRTILAYSRIGKRNEFLILLNFSDKRRRFINYKEGWLVAFATHHEIGSKLDLDIIYLEAFEVLVLKRQLPKKKKRIYIT